MNKPFFEHWSIDEDQTLLDLFHQLNNSRGENTNLEEIYYQISQKMGNRSPKAIRRRLQRIKSSDHRLPEPNSEILDQESISHILNSACPILQKVNELKIYNPAEVIQAIINTADHCPTSIFHMGQILGSYISKYEEVTSQHEDAFIDIFTERQCYPTCRLLLQVLAIYEYYTKQQLFQLFSSLIEDPFFPIFPIARKQISPNEKIKTARITLHEKRMTQKLSVKTKEVNVLHDTINSLHDIYEDKMQALNQKITMLKQNANSIFQIQQNQFQVQMQKTRSFHLNDDAFNKYPLLCALLNKVNNKGSEFYLKFCTIINTISSSAYTRLHKMLPFYSPTRIKEFTHSFRSQLTDMIQNRECIHSLLRIVYDKQIEFTEQDLPCYPILITLCGDGASVKPAFESSKNAVYTFEVLPLNGMLPTCVIHMCPASNGSSSNDIVKTFDILSGYLTKLNYVVKFRATDGDVSFDKKHREYFAKFKDLLGGNFYDIVHSLQNDIEIPISDPLHLLKTARSRLLNHLLMIDPTEYRCVNTSLFAAAVQLGPVFTDKTSAAAMKDAYALSMFSWYTFTTLMEKGRFEAAFYVLPYVYLVESIRSPLLSKNTRLSFLAYAFDIFKHHYQQVTTSTSDDMFLPRYKKTALGVLFGDEIFLIRLMNTCLGLAIGINSNISTLALARIGSHDLELFYGFMRIVSHFNHSYSNAIHSAVRAIILRKYSQDIGYPVKITKRDNTGGIILTDEINTLDNLIYDGDLITSIVYNLMRGRNVDEENLFKITKYINDYTTKISSCKIYRVIKIPHVMAGISPWQRNTSISYTMSLLPVPINSSTFDFYSKDKLMKENLSKASVYQWCLRLFSTILGKEQSYPITNDFGFPFQVDLSSQEGREQIQNYLNNPLNESLNEILHHASEFEEDMQNEPETHEEEEACGEEETHEEDEAYGEEETHEEDEAYGEEETHEEESRDSEEATNEIQTEEEDIVDNTINVPQESAERQMELSNQVFQECINEQECIHEEEPEQPTTTSEQEIVDDHVDLITNLDKDSYLETWLHKHKIPVEKAMDLIYKVGETEMIKNLTKAK